MGRVNVAGGSVLTGNMVAADLLLNKTGYAADPKTKITGTKDLTNLIATNLKDTVVAGGVTGTYDHEAANPITAVSVLLNKIGFVNGVKVTGTMPDRAGDTVAVSLQVNTTTIKLKASEGYRDGVNDYVTITDPDFTPANIKNGVNIFNNTGNYDYEATNPITAADVIAPHVGFVNGAKITGTAAGAGFATGALVANGNGFNGVSGLGFAPRVVFMFCEYASSMNKKFLMVLTNADVSDWAGIAHMMYITNANSGGTYTQGSIGTNYLTADGFSAVPYPPISYPSVGSYYAFS